MKHGAVLTVIVFIIAILIISGTVVGIVFGINANKPKNDIEIILVNSVGEQDIGMKLSGIYPGSSSDYDITFKGDERLEYALTLSFIPGEKVELGEYIVVDVVVDDEVVASDRLITLLDGKKIVIDAITTASKVTIRYTMPEETDNEAVNTAVEFALRVMVSR